MSDDPNKRSVQDRSKINLSEDYEVRYWTEKFNCSEEELRKAVEAAGSGARHVEEYLKGRS